MSLLDTHIWIWWVQAVNRLSSSHLAYLTTNQPNGFGVSVYSVWEVAMLEAKGKVNFSVPVDVWVRQALSTPGIHLLDLTPDIAIESVFLPGSFHKDPADRILVATARVLNISIVTQDAKILAYPHVRCAP